MGIGFINGICYKFMAGCHWTIEQILLFPNGLGTQNNMELLCAVGWDWRDQRMTLCFHG